MVCSEKESNQIQVFLPQALSATASFTGEKSTIVLMKDCFGVTQHRALKDKLGEQRHKSTTRTIKEMTRSTDILSSSRDTQIDKHRSQFIISPSDGHY